MGLVRDFIQEFERIKDAIETENFDGLKLLLEDYHPSEIARFLEALSQTNRQKILLLLPTDIVSQVIVEMDPESHPEKLLEDLHPGRAGAIVDELSDDDAADLLKEMSLQKREEILHEMDAEDAQDIRRLLTYSEDTAGGLMTTEIIKIKHTLTKKDALEEVIRQSEEMEDIYDIYVIDETERYIGYLSLTDLIRAKPQDKVINLMDEDIVYVEAHEDQEKVAKTLSQYNLHSIAVVDKHLRLLGGVSFDDAMDVLEEETTEDILRISGVSDNEELAGNWWEAVKSRLPWLIVNLGTAFLAASVVRSYHYTVAHLVILSAYMTMIAGMGGNAATQALAVTIRRISLNTISDNQAKKLIFKEFLVGLTNGAITGVIVLLAAFIFDQNLLLGLVIFLAMTGNLVIAGIAGSTIPIMLKKVGIDPAIASSIIITTFTDIVGFFLLLGLGSRLLL